MGAMPMHCPKGTQSTVVPLICETLGGVNRDAYRTLYRLHKLATTEGHRDGTVYGTARTATRSFHAHHLRLISLAINVAIAPSTSPLPSSSPRGRVYWPAASSRLTPRESAAGGWCVHVRG